MCEIRTRITKKRKKFTVSHELRTCESGFAHCACEHNSPAKKGYKQYEKMCAFSFKLNSEINLQLKYYRILYNIFMYFYKDS